MVEGLYTLLEKVGFSHPLHPMMVHIPMGMIIGMVIFSLINLVWQKPRLGETAYHCSVLALLSIFPAIIAGMLDWLHLLEGSWSGLIIVKMVLAAVLTALLATSLVLKHRGADAKTLTIVYLLCLACAGGLGFSGGELVYG